MKHISTLKEQRWQKSKLQAAIHAKNKNTTCIGCFLGMAPLSWQLRWTVKNPCVQTPVLPPTYTRGEKCILVVPPICFLFAASKYSSTNFFNAWILSGNTAGAPGKLRNSIVNRNKTLTKMFAHVGVVVGANHCGISPSRRFVFVICSKCENLDIWGLSPSNT